MSPPGFDHGGISFDSRIRHGISPVGGRAPLEIGVRCRRGWPGQGLLKLLCRCSRSKDSEGLSTGGRLYDEPEFSTDSHAGYLQCRALPVGIGAPTLQSVRYEKHPAVTDDEAAASEAPPVSTSSSDGEHTRKIGHSGLAL